MAGIAGDQQAALFGHGCVHPGQAKATYGTGSFVLAHAGDDVSPAPHGLLRTAAVEGTALYALFHAPGYVHGITDSFIASLPMGLLTPFSLYPAIREKTSVLGRLALMGWLSLLFVLLILCTANLAAPRYTQDFYPLLCLLGNLGAWSMISRPRLCWATSVSTIAASEPLRKAGKI